MKEFFTAKDVVKTFGLTCGRLRYWDRSGFMSPSKTQGKIRRYSSTDLICIEVALRLLKAGLSLQRIRRGVKALKSQIPKIKDPLSQLIIATNGSRLIVSYADSVFDETGQTIISATVGELEEQIRTRILRGRKRRAAKASRPKEVSLERDLSKAGVKPPEQWYEQGCRLDQDNGGYEEAIEAYKNALVLDPFHYEALVNLGRIYYDKGWLLKAAAEFKKAIEANSLGVEGHYNLAHVWVDMGRLDEAIEEYEKALQIKPNYADAHFNIASAYYEKGLKEQARVHWREYIRLDPQSKWAATARNYLREL